MYYMAVKRKNAHDSLSFNEIREMGEAMALKYDEDAEPVKIYSDKFESAAIGFCSLGAKKSDGFKTVVDEIRKRLNDIEKRNVRFSGYIDDFLVSYHL